MQALIASAALALAVPLAGAMAEVRAVVVGIDAYEHINDLTGAVNDARLVSDALSEAGVEDLTVLLDGEATRDAILTGFAAAMQRAEPGDVLILHYAGHGGVIPTEDLQNEPDGTDEILILSGYDRADLRQRDYIKDDEIEALFAARDDVTVLFFADTCHSGTMDRRADPRAEGLPTRSPLEAAETEIEPMAFDIDTIADMMDAADVRLGHVFHFGAVRDNELVREYPVRGVPHGLLSVYLQRAIAGDADADRDGWLSKGELERFIVGGVERHSNGLQRPQVHPSFDEDLLLLPIADMTSGEEPPVTVALINAEQSTVAQARRLLGRLLAGPEDRADLIWDLETDQIIEANEPVAYYPPAGALPSFVDMIATIRRIADKWELIRSLRDLALTSGLDILIEPDAGVHADGTEVVFTVAGRETGAITMFNLASDGTIQFMYPARAGDAGVFPTGEPIRLRATAQAPFGADHLVVLASARPLTEVQRMLARPDVTASDLRRAIESAAAAGTVQVGVLGAYTRP